MTNIEILLRLQQYTKNQNVYLMALGFILKDKAHYIEYSDSIETLFRDLQHIEDLMFENMNDLSMMEEELQRKR